MSAREPGSGAVVPVQLQELDCLSSVRIYIPKDLRPPDTRQMALKVAQHPAAHPSFDLAVEYGADADTVCSASPMIASKAQGTLLLAASLCMTCSISKCYALLGIQESTCVNRVGALDSPGCVQAVAEVQRRYPEGIPLLSPEEDMSVKDPAFRKAQRCAVHQILTHLLASW